MSKETAVRVASIIKYKGERDKLVFWLHGITGKVTSYEKRLILNSAKKGNYIVWIDGYGIKIL